MIEEAVPAAVAAVEVFADPPDATLYPEEEALVSRAVDKRRREFTTGRFCARRALARLGLPPVPIVQGERGAPRWPDGVAGTITHCQGYRAAAVAYTRDVHAVGIDAEPNEALPAGVLGVVSTGRERDRLAALTATAPLVCWDRLLFCAKEAVYKAWFPLTGRWLDFGEADITIDAARGTFGARLLVPGPVAGGRQLDGFTGRWLVRHGLILTAITVPA